MKIFLIGFLMLLPGGMVQSQQVRGVMVQTNTPESTKPEDRVALVIGNGAYRKLPLKNPVNDARSIAGLLKKLNFRVILKENLTQNMIGSTLREFRSSIKPGAIALFFYAGHGLQIRGVNYLPAVDADIASEDDVPTQSFDVGKIIELMDEQKTRMNLIFLDACRNSPFGSSFRSWGSGLAKIEAPSGTIISYATRPGSIAIDGTGDHGLYTKFLLEAMNEQGVVVEQALKQVLAGVRRASSGLQEPWFEGGIEGNFYFRPPAVEIAHSPAVLPKDDQPTVELAFWNSVKDTQNPEELKAYLTKFPNGNFIILAKERLKAVSKMHPDPSEVSIFENKVITVANKNIPVLSQGPIHEQENQSNVTNVNYKIPVSKMTDSIRLSDGQSLDFVMIPQGIFKMGSSNDKKESPIHLVTISNSFLMQTTPVTFGQFQTFVKETGYRTDIERVGGGLNPANYGYGTYSRLRYFDWRNPRFHQDNNCPVVMVTWNDANEFIQWLKGKYPKKRFRLPTEAEWEYACKAGGDTERYGPIEQIAWYIDNSKRKTHPVAQKLPNNFGLFDMLGNVWQWCQDWQSPYPNQDVVDPHGPDTGAFHTCRGGSWKSPEASIRAACRFDNEANASKFEENTIGFRVVEEYAND